MKYDRSQTVSIF